MKKLVALILLFCFIGNSAFGSCDWKTGITPGPNDTFIYSSACHRAVGDLVQANKDLTSAIQLKDLAIQMSDSRVALWSKTAGDEQQRLAKLESDQRHSDWLFFGLGIATTFVAAYSAGQLIHH